MLDLRQLIILFSGLLLLPFAAATARAETTITLSAVDSGWYKPDGSHKADNDNYTVGKVGVTGELRNFFVFDLSTIRGPIRNATLRVINPGAGYNSVDAQES